MAVATSALLLTCICLHCCCLNREICDAATKKGIKADMIKANLTKLQGLVPGLNPNLDQMKASDWVGGLIGSMQLTMRIMLSAEQPCVTAGECNCYFRSGCSDAELKQPHLS